LKQKIVKKEILTCAAFFCPPQCFFCKAKKQSVFFAKQKMGYALRLWHFFAPPKAEGLLRFFCTAKGGGAASLFLQSKKMPLAEGKALRVAVWAKPKPRQKKALLRRGYWQNLGANNSRG